MRIKTAGQITDDFCVMGHPGVPVYLLDGTVPVLFDAGFTVLGPRYIEDVRKILGNRAPRYLFLTHTHFDHVGAAVQFKREWPELAIVGAPMSQEILSRPKAIETIRGLNHEMERMVESQFGISVPRVSFEPFALDRFVASSQTMTLSTGSSVLAIHAPGHTRDFMSYWLPERKILIASEAAGCDDGSGHIVPEFLIDYQMYRKSLQDLCRYDAQVLCPGHRVVLTGEDVKDYLRQSLDEAATYVTMVKTFLMEEGGSIEKAVARVKAAEWDSTPLPKQPEVSYVLNTRARVRCLKRDLQPGELREGREAGTERAGP